MSVRIEGLSRLRQKLGMLNEGERDVTKREVKRAALNVQTGAKRRAPVDTGRLRNSITHEERDEGLAAVVGTNVDYAPHVEFGTRFQHGQPYLFPAFEEERPKFVARLKKALNGEIRKVSR